MRPPTKRQLEVLAYIAGCYPPPTYRQICKHFGWASVKTAQDHVNNLIKAGYLVRFTDEVTTRNIKLAPHLGWDGRRFYEKVDLHT